MAYTTEHIEGIAAKLREMPPVEKKKQQRSKQEAIKMLSKEINALKKRGYTLDQIAETLRGEGLDIKAPTLKSYLQRAKGKAVKKAPANASADTPSTLTVNASADAGAASTAAFIPKPDSDEI